MVLYFHPHSNYKKKTHPTSLYGVTTSVCQLTGHTLTHSRGHAPHLDLHPAQTTLSCSLQSQLEQATSVPVGFPHLWLADWTSPATPLLTLTAPPWGATGGGSGGF